MKTKIVQIISVLMLAAILIVTASQTDVAAALAPTKAWEQATVQPAGPTVPQELEAFLDEFIPANLEENHIPGATISVVKDGELLLAKGYGFADLDSHRAVIADQSLFGIGSASKLFTWTAVMQLAEQGKVDINADVNTYLEDFQIPATYDQPITLAHLMTHTAGFEEIQERLFITDIEKKTPLSDYVIDYLPERIYAPGLVAAYSNYGTALAGYIVEQVSGQHFEQYTEEHILTPLGMTRTTFREPLPSALAGDEAVGYQFMNGDYKPLTFWIQGFPAGSIWSTADDMAKFMIAHLQDGRYGDNRILQADTAREMHRQHFLADPHASGMAYGFVELQINGKHIIWHAGGRVVFMTGLWLLPQDNLGVFISYNGNNGESARETFIHAFMDHYYPGSPVSVPQPKPDFAERAKRFVGTYQNSRHNESTYEKINLVVNNVPVTLTSENTLGMGREQWIETENPLVFIRDDGQDHMIFQENETGNITGFVVQNWPINVFFRQNWMDTAQFTILWSGVGQLFFLSCVFVWPLKLIFSRRKRKQSAGMASPMPARIARWLAWSYSLLSLCFFVTFLIRLINGMLNTEGHYAMAGLFLIPPLTVVMAIGMIVFTALAWARRYWTLSGRVYYTLLTLAAISFIGWLNYFNLISLPF